MTIQTKLSALALVAAALGVTAVTAASAAGSGHRFVGASKVPDVVLKRGVIAFAPRIDIAVGHGSVSLPARGPGLRE